MVRLRRLAVASCIVAAMALSQAHAVELVDFHSESGRFRIAFPGPDPHTRQMSEEKFQLTTNNVQHHVEVDRTRFAVELHDIPRAAAMFLTDDFVLEQAKQGMLDDMGGQELTSNTVERQSHPARRVEFEIPESGLRGDLLLVLAKRRLYLVTSLYPKHDEPPIPFNAYAESFEFWLE